LKILGADSMIDTRDATLYETPKALNAIGVNVAQSIDLCMELNAPRAIVQSSEV